MSELPDPDGLRFGLIELHQRATSFGDLMWSLLGAPVFRCTFHNWYGARRALLRVFGARIHPTARLRPTALILHPANLTIGEESSVGDHAILNCVSPITIGARCTISQYAYLCSAASDYSDRSRPRIDRPIVIEDHAWVAADAYIGAGVTIGAGALLAARSSAFASLSGWSIWGGDEPVRLGDRHLKG